MDKPVLQRPRPAEPPGRSLLSIFLALTLGVALLSGLVLLTFAILGPLFLVAFMVVGAIFFVIAMHYFVWGWWLGGIIRKEVETEEKEDE